MWTFRHSLVLSSLLQAAAFAWADNTLPQNSTTPDASNSPVRSLPRMHFFSERPLNPAEKSTKEDPGFHSEISGNSNKFAPLDTRPPGLNFVLTGQHPGLEYKFSENAGVHFHANAHGAGATAVWGF
jgi:hypothetical protein